jgi:hypothetical protein
MVPFFGRFADTSCTQTMSAVSVIRGIASLSGILIGSGAEGPMTVWPDPRTEQLSQMVHELTTRLLVETDPKKLNELIEQMTQIVERQIRHGLQN